MFVCIADDAGTSRQAPKKKKRNKIKYDAHGYPIYKDWVPTPATEAEKSMLRQEFLTHMHQRFLSGKDNDFDYASVDHNVDYDSLDIRTQDEEEQYFDEESPDDDLSHPGGDASEMEIKTGGGKEEGVKEEEELEEWETYGMDADAGSGEGNEDEEKNSTSETAEVTSMERWNPMKTKDSMAWKFLLVYSIVQTIKYLVTLF